MMNNTSSPHDPDDKGQDHMNQNTPSLGEDSVQNASSSSAASASNNPSPEAQAQAATAHDKPLGDGVASDKAVRRNRYPARLRSRKEDGSGPQQANNKNRGKGKPRGPFSDKVAESAQEQQNRASVFMDVVSGAFDQQEESSPAEEASKRVLKPEPETPKLHKVLAQSGLGSRLDMEQLILEGRISVNNEPAHIGQRIQYGDQVRVNGKALRVRIDPPATRVLAYHKPVGEVVTMDDPQNRPTVFHSLPRLQNGKWQAVGRLDLNTEGLLLFSNSGELINRLTHPRFGLEREYAVRILGALSAEEKQKLLDSIELGDGPAQFKSIEDGGGEGANCWYRVTITEGRNREVRRMFESLGHAVSRLIRIRYGAMVLPKGLRRGTWMELDERDVQALSAAAGMPAGTGDRRLEKSKGGYDKKNGKPFASKNGRPGEKGRGRGHGNKGGNEAQTEGKRTQFQGNKRGHGKNNEAMLIPNPLTTAAASVHGRGRNKNTGSVHKPSGENGRGNGGQPDPMLTSVGYIGADSYRQKRKSGGDARRSGGGKRRF